MPTAPLSSTRTCCSRDSGNKVSSLSNVITSEGCSPASGVQTGRCEGLGVEPLPTCRSSFVLCGDNPARELKNAGAERLDAPQCACVRMQRRMAPLLVAGPRVGRVHTCAFPTPICENKTQTFPVGAPLVRARPGPPRTRAAVNTHAQEGRFDLQSAVPLRCHGYGEGRDTASADGRSTRRCRDARCSLYRRIRGAATERPSSAASPALAPAAPRFRLTNSLENAATAAGGYEHGELGAACIELSCCLLAAAPSAATLAAKALVLCRNERVPPAQENVVVKRETAKGASANGGLIVDPREWTVRDRRRRCICRTCNALSSEATVGEAGFDARAPMRARACSDRPNAALGRRRQPGH
eukprot:366296-Chlamydomonas_euryale.AAC.13